MTKVTKVEELIPNINTMEIFQPMFSYGKWFGFCGFTIVPNSTYNKTKWICLWMLFFISHGVMWSNPIKLIFVIYREAEDTGRLLPIMATFTFFMGVSYIATSQYIALNKHFQPFCCSLDEHHIIHRASKNKYYIHKLIKNGIPVSIFVTILFTGSYSVLLYMVQEKLSQLFYPFNFSDYLNVTSVMVYLILNVVFVTVIQSCQLILFVTISLTFIFQFNEIINSLCEAVVDVKDSSQDRIEKLRQEYVSLVNCLQLANKIIQNYLFGLYAMCVPIVCFVLYGLIRGRLLWAEILFIMPLVVLDVGGVAVYTFIGAHLNTKAHDALDVLMKIDVQSVPDKTAQSVSLFVSRLTGPSIGFHIYGLFTLDTNAILTLFSTLVTYAIVMLQFSDTSPPPPTLPCNCTSLPMV